MSKLLLAILSTCFLLLSIQAAAENKLTISKDQFGDKWPLSVSSGVVKCLAIGNGSVVFEAEGKTYAVNSTAKGFANRYEFHPIEDIWLDDPEFLEMARVIAKSENKPVNEIMKAMGTPTKMNIGPVLDSGLKLCK
jgi:Protein of unknown function (DUF2511)